MTSRTWIKIYCNKWLEGSLKDDSLELRGFWITLLTLAGSGQYGDRGIIQVTEGVGLTPQQLAKIIGIPYRRVGHFIAKLVDLGRISINNDDVICITNWQKYQSEYGRQKPYREAKLPPKSYNQELQSMVTPQGATQERERERDTSKERERDVVVDAFRNIGITISSAELKILSEQYSDESILYAVREASDRGKPNIKYIGGILRNHCVSVEERSQMECDGW
jgi:hypothetical protein